MSAPDEDLFGPPPEPPHPVEHMHARPRATIVEAPDPRNSKQTMQLIERIKRSRFLQDVCMCGIGDPDRAITDARRPKCCKRCPWCSTRVKIAFWKDHTAWCMAPDRSIVPVPWWRRSDGVSSRHAGESDAKPIEQAGAVHGDGRPPPRASAQEKPAASQRSEGVRRSRPGKRPPK